MARSLRRVSTVVADRPAPLSRVWSGSKIIAEDLTGEDLSDVLELHSDASAWWVLPRDPDYGAVELRHVARALDLDELAIKDLLANDRRAKFEAIGQARLVITNAVSVHEDSAQILVHPVSMIATDRAVICLMEPTPDFQPAQLLVEKQELIARGGIEAAVQTVIAAVIRTYEDALQWLEDASDNLANVLFEERPLNRPEQLHAFKLRSALSQLRRLTDPMRTVMSDIVDRPPQGRKAKAGRDAAIGRHWVVLAEQHGPRCQRCRFTARGAVVDFRHQSRPRRCAAEPDREEAQRMGGDHRSSHPGHGLCRDERRVPAGGESCGLLGLFSDHDRGKCGALFRFPRQGVALTGLVRHRGG